MIVFSRALDFTPTVTLGGSFPGWPIENLKNTAINLDWFSADKSETEIRFDLGNDWFVKGIFLHKINLEDYSELELRLQKDAGQTDIVPIPADAIVYDQYNRGRFYIDVDAAGFTDAYRYVFFKIAANANVKFVSLYNIGAAYILFQKNTIINPSWGMTCEHVNPVIASTLANGARAVATAGPDYDIFDLTFQAIRDRGQYPEFTIYDELKRFGPIVIDMEYHDWLIRPAILENYRNSTALNSGLDQITMQLRELVTL